MSEVFREFHGIQDEAFDKIHKGLFGNYSFENNYLT